MESCRGKGNEAECCRSTTHWTEWYHVAYFEHESYFWLSNILTPSYIWAVPQSLRLRRKGKCVDMFTSKIFHLCRIKLSISASSFYTSHGETTAPGRAVSLLQLPKNSREDCAGGIEWMNNLLWPIISNLVSWAQSYDNFISTDSTSLFTDAQHWVSRSAMGQGPWFHFHSTQLAASYGRQWSWFKKYSFCWQKYKHQHASQLMGSYPCRSTSSFQFSKWNSDQNQIRHPVTGHVSLTFAKHQFMLFAYWAIKISLGHLKSWYLLFLLLYGSQCLICSHLLATINTN